MCLLSVCVCYSLCVYVYGVTTCNAKINDLDLPADEDEVLQLQVGMDDILFVNNLCVWVWVYACVYMHTDTYT